MKRSASILTLLLLLLLAAPALCEEAEITDADARYVATARLYATIRAEPDRNAERLGGYNEGARVLIAAYDPEWLTVIRKDADGNWFSGYILRHLVEDVRQLDDDAPRYGTVPAVYAATIRADTFLRTAPSDSAQTLFVLKPGSRVGILSIEDGWAKVIYWREYAYFYLDNTVGLSPILPPDEAEPGDLLAAYQSFYSLVDTPINHNRWHNIAKACEFISITLAPGEEFSANNVIGPYQLSRGYLHAISYFEGQAVESVGGGTCQVSSTLYNALLPLDGIEILYRRAHGPSGASYLPHGVDAAVGNATLNLIFRNDYAFPIRIEAHSLDGALFIALVKE